MATDKARPAVALAEPAVEQESAANLLEGLPDDIARKLGVQLGRVTDLGGTPAPVTAAQSLATRLSPEVRKLTARLLDQIASAYRTAPSGEVLKRQLEELKTAYLGQLARSAENVSVENRDLEKQILNIVTILRNASAGRTDAENALYMEVYNSQANALMTNEDAWTEFKQMLIDRQANQLVADVGYNLVVLPMEIAGPAMSGDERTLTLKFLERLMDLGQQLGIMFFLDVYPAGKHAEKEGFDKDSVKERARVGEECTDVLNELDWTRKGVENLGKMIQSIAGGQKKTQWVVLNGGLALYADRKPDTDLKGSLGPAARPVCLSAAAEAAGLLAWSAGGQGIVGLPTGGSVGKGAMRAKVATPPTDKQHELSRGGGVNISYLSTVSSSPTFDGSFTLQRADPVFKEQGRGTLEAVMVEQLLRRFLRRLMINMPTNANTPEGRHKHIVAPMEKLLTELVGKSILRRASCKDETDSKMEERGLLKIRVPFTEVAKVDTGKVVVERDVSVEAPPGTQGR